MTKPVLQTRCIGMKPHFSGHPLAPMEYVYECSEPPRRSFLSRLTSFSLGVITVVLVAFGIGAMIRDASALVMSLLG